MPELPEVEVVKRSLSNNLQNLIVKEVKINDGRLRYLVDKNKIRNIIGLKLEKNFNYIYFKKYIIGRNRSIKDILMDQKFLSGLGNIYTNEILFLSKIKPTRKVNKLKIFEIKKLIKFTKRVLNSSIKFGGSSIKDFSSSNGKKGSFQQHFNVYGKKKESCSNVNCKSKIEKIVISNRATFYCPKCQKY